METSDIIGIVIICGSVAVIIVWICIVIKLRIVSKNLATATKHTLLLRLQHEMLSDRTPEEYRRAINIILKTIPIGWQLRCLTNLNDFFKGRISINGSVNDSKIQ